MGLKGLHTLVVEDAPDVLTVPPRLEGADVVGAPERGDATTSSGTPAASSYLRSSARPLTRTAAVWDRRS
jgi:hypothetical protein